MGDGTVSEDEIGGILFISGYTLKDVALPSASARRDREPPASTAKSATAAVSSALTLGAPARPVGTAKVMEDGRSRPRPIRRPGEEDFTTVGDAKRRKRSRPVAAAATAAHAEETSRGLNTTITAATRTFRRASAAQPVNELNAHSRAALAFSNIAANNPPATARLSRAYLHVRIAWQIYYDRAVHKPLLEAKEVTATKHYRGATVPSAFLTPTIHTQSAHSVSSGLSYPTVTLQTPSSLATAYPVVNLVPPMPVAHSLSAGLHTMFAVSHAASAPSAGGMAPGSTQVIIA